MLEAMPDLTLGEVARRAVEEWFEGRNDREFARICIEEDLKELLAQWERQLGVTVSFTLTPTEEGFRAVLVALKKYNG
jgi:hypothetical protein